VDPVTLGIIAGVMALLAGGVSAYSQIKQGQQAEGVGRYNAQVAEQQATSARQAAAVDAENKRRQMDRILGTQRARYGASGVIGSEGSPLLVMMQSEEEAALDVARVRYGGEAQAYGLESEAKLQRFRGTAAKRQGYLGATGSILTGVAGAGGAFKGVKPPAGGGGRGSSLALGGAGAYRGYGYD